MDYFSRRRIQESEDRQAQCGLARTTLTYDTNDFSPLRVQGDTIQDSHSAINGNEVNCQVIDAKQVAITASLRESGRIIRWVSRSGRRSLTAFGSVGVIEGQS
jgi:hypothetical protein